MAFFFADACPDTAKQRYTRSTRYKARAIATKCTCCSRIDLRYRLVETDLFKGDTKTSEFLIKNPEGSVPVLELPDMRYLAGSNANLVYLAEGTPFLPEDWFERSEVLRWMFFEQHSHEPAIAATRLWLHLVKVGRELRTHKIDQYMEHGYEVLSLMVRCLAVIVISSARTPPSPISRFMRISCRACRRIRSGRLSAYHRLARANRRRA